VITITTTTRNLSVNMNNVNMQTRFVYNQSMVDTNYFQSGAQYLLKQALNSKNADVLRGQSEIFNCPQDMFEQFVAFVAEALVENKDESIVRRGIPNNADCKFTIRDDQDLRACFGMHKLPSKAHKKGLLTYMYPIKVFYNPKRLGMRFEFTLTINGKVLARTASGTKKTVNRKKGNKPMEEGMHEAAVTAMQERISSIASSSDARGADLLPEFLPVTPLHVTSRSSPPLEFLPVDPLPVSRAARSPPDLSVFRYVPTSGPPLQATSAVSSSTACALLVSPYFHSIAATSYVPVHQRPSPYAFAHGQVRSGDSPIYLDSSDDDSESPIDYYDLEDFDVDMI
jgi:hypothetical protein